MDEIMETILFEALQEISEFSGVLDSEDAQEMINLANLAIARFNKEKEKIEALEMSRKQVLADVKRAKKDAKILCPTCKSDCSAAGKIHGICGVKVCKFYEE